MILVFAPNPALERVALVQKPSSDPAVDTSNGRAHPSRPMRVGLFAGGAGMRAATVARLLGGDVFALGFAGGHLGVILRECLDRQEVPFALTSIAADTRGSFLVLDRDKGVVGDIPDSAAAFTAEEADSLLKSLQAKIGNASLLLIADGPEERPVAATAAAQLFSRAVKIAQDAGVPVLADVSGPGFDAAVDGGVSLLRIGYQALQRRTERSLQHDSGIIDEARELLARGVENVVVTIGEEGALLINSEGAWRVKAPIVSHFNPTGSGETLSGALAVMWERTGDLLDAVRYGCAAASVNVTHDEPGYATPGEVGVLYPRTVVGPVIVR